MSQHVQQRALLAVIVVVTGCTAAFAFFAATRPSLASAPSEAALAPTDNFLCTPNGVAAFDGRVHVRCTTGGPPSSAIFYFAVCTAPNPAHAGRMLSVFTTAKVTAKNLMIFYNAADTTSGAACGCASGDCRLTYGAEVQQ